jgi:imidazole glycerol-phosphate synthase subunit HisH
MIQIAVLDYGVTNVLALANTLKSCEFDVEVVDGKSTASYQKCDLLVLPGIGKWDYGKAMLDSNGLSDEILLRNDEKKKIFGVCLGMQLMAKDSQEGKMSGLGLVNCSVKQNPKQVDSHTSVNNGWSQIIPYGEIKSSASQFDSYDRNDQFYFSHSFSLVAKEIQEMYPHYAVTTPIGKDFVASFQSENLSGVQFHPERSHIYGIKFLKRFIENWFE